MKKEMQSLFKFIIFFVMMFKWKSINTYIQKIYRTLLTFYTVTMQDMRIIGVLRNIEMDVGS